MYLTQKIDSVVVLINYVWRCSEDRKFKGNIDAPIERYNEKLKDGGLRTKQEILRR